MNPTTSSATPRNIDEFKALFFDVAADGLILVNETGIILKTNASFSSMSGCLDGDLIGASIFDIIDLGALQRVLSDSNELSLITASKSPLKGKITCLNKIIPVELLISCHSDLFITLYYVCVRDLSETVRAEEAKTAVNALSLAKKHAQAGEEVKSRFLRVMSHELRTPLNALCSAVELIKEEPLSDKLAELVELIDFTSRTAIEQVNSVIGFTGLSDSLTSTPEGFDLEALFMGVVDKYRSIATSKGLNCHYKIDVDKHLSLYGRPDIISLILQNLISNAVRFTNSGQVCASVGFIPDGSLLQIDVVDTGPGLLEDDVKIALDDGREASEMSLDNPSLGLGLFLVSSAVRDLEGEISISPTEDGGTHISVTLPVTFSPGSHDDPVAPDIENPASGSQVVQHAMIVDDNHVNLMVLEMRLSSLGLRVSKALGGEEVIQIIKQSGDDLPDIIFMDRDMPVVNGIEATRRIKDMPFIPDIPIIGTSAFVNRSIIDEMLSSGMSHVLEKPLSEDKLASILKTPGVMKSGHVDEEIYASHLESVREQLRTEVPLLIRAISNNEYTNAAEFAHRLAGSFAVIQKQSEHEAMILIEMTLRRGLKLDSDTLERLQSLEGLI